MSATVSSAGQRDGVEGGGRDARGRFAAGNRYGPGNPFARQTAQLRKALLEVVTPQELRQVAFTLLLLAKAGKLEATKLLFQYVLGKPAEGVDPDRLEVEEWKLSQESRVNPAAVQQTVDHLPADAANVLVRHAWPASTETNYLSAVREELQAMDTEDAERARGQEDPAETNGDNGEASPLTPDPSPPKRGRGEEEEGGEVAARGGRSAKPQAAKGRPGVAPSTNGGDGANGRHRRSSGANGKAAGSGAGGSPPPPLPPQGRVKKEGRPRSREGGGENGSRAEANGGNGPRPSPARGGGGSGRARCP